MKKSILLFITCFFAMNVSAMEKVTDKALLGKLADNLTKSGKYCSKCIDAYILSRDSEQIVYKAICIDRVEPYTVTLTPTGEPKEKKGNFLDMFKKNPPGSL